MLNYMNWFPHDFWTRTGGWEFDHPHGSGISSPSHWQQVEQPAPKPLGWMMCFLLMTFVPVQKPFVFIYIYMYMHFLYVFSFLWFTDCALLADDNSLIRGCLWLLAFVLNFFQNIGFNMVPSDPFMSHLATQLGYSAGKFQACNWMSVRRLPMVSWINHLHPAYWSTFWKSILNNSWAVGLT